MNQVRLLHVYCVPATMTRLAYSPQWRPGGLGVCLGRYSHRVVGENAALALVAAWGPSLVLLFIVLFVARFVQSNLKAKRPVRPLGMRSGSPYSGVVSGVLQAALDDAIGLNSFDVQSRNDPSVRLRELVRLEPRDYGSVVNDIVRNFRQRQVMSIDLAGMEESHAVRLVEFCSGMAAACSGWIFLVTDSVIVVTPPF